MRELKRNKPKMEHSYQLPHYMYIVFCILMGSYFTRSWIFKELTQAKCGGKWLVINNDTDFGTLQFHKLLIAIWNWRSNPKKKKCMGRRKTFSSGTTRFQDISPNSKRNLILFNHFLPSHFARDPWKFKIEWNIAPHPYVYILHCMPTLHIKIIWKQNIQSFYNLWTLSRKGDYVNFESSAISDNKICCQSTSPSSSPAATRSLTKKLPQLFRSSKKPILTRSEVSTNLRVRCIHCINTIFVFFVVVHFTFVPFLHIIYCLRWHGYAGMVDRGTFNIFVFMMCKNHYWHAHIKDRFVGCTNTKYICVVHKRNTHTSM